MKNQLITKLKYEFFFFDGYTFWFRGTYPKLIKIIVF